MVLKYITGTSMFFRRSINGLSWYLSHVNISNYLKVRIQYMCVRCPKSDGMKRNILDILLLFIGYVIHNVYGFHWPVFPSYFRSDLTPGDDLKRGFSNCPSCVYETKWFDQNIDHFIL